MMTREMESIAKICKYVGIFLLVKWCYRNKMAVFWRPISSKITFLWNGETQDDDHHAKMASAHYSRTANGRTSHNATSYESIMTTKLKSKHQITPFHRCLCMLCFILGKKKCQTKWLIFLLNLSPIHTQYFVSSVWNLFELLLFKRYERWPSVCAMILYFKAKHLHEIKHFVSIFIDTFFWRFFFWNWNKR